LEQHWEKLLFFTGKALNLQKGFWYLVTWQWKNGVPRLATILQSPSALPLTNGYETTLVEAPRIEPTSAFQTLGVYISPTGDQKKQIQILRAYSQDYFDRLQSTPFTTTEAYLLYSIHLQPKLTFPLPFCSLTPIQCRFLQALALAALLPKLHLNRHTPCTILFARPTNDGLSLPELDVNQSVGQLQYIIGHVKLQDEISQQIFCQLTYL